MYLNNESRKNDHVRNRLFFFIRSISQFETYWINGNSLHTPHAVKYISGYPPNFNTYFRN